MADLELRSAKRYPLTASVIFWWFDSAGSTQEGHGATRDISDAGVMIMSEACPPVDVQIQMSVFVPRREESRCQLELHGEGRVVRVEEASASSPGELAKGFAASVQFYPESISNVEELGRNHS